MKYRLIALLLVLCLLPVSAFTLGSDDAALDSELDSIMRKCGVTGSQVAVVQGGNLVYSYCWGICDREGSPVTQDTHFIIASITKMVTAIGVMQLVEEGKLSLDEDLGVYYGFPVGNPYFPDTPITLRQVLSHTSSLTDEHNFPAGQTIAWQLDPTRYNNWTRSEPGTEYRYSNMNGGLFGNLIELISGQSVDDYMKEHVFRPLGIDASYSPNRLEHPETVSATFTSGGSIASTAKYQLVHDRYADMVCDPTYNYKASVGALYFCANDLARLAYVLCRDGSIDGVRILQPETVELMRTDQSTVPGSSVHTPGSDYGLSVEISIDDLTPVHWYGHQGMIDDIISNAYFCPELDTAVVFLNSGTSSRLFNHIGGVSRRVVEAVYTAVTE